MACCGTLGSTDRDREPAQDTNACKNSDKRTHADFEV